MYNAYANNGSQTLKLNTTEPTVTKSNGVYTVSQLNVTHTGYTKTVGNNTINFSGISGIYVEYYNKMEQKLVKIKYQHIHKQIVRKQQNIFLLQEKR